MSENGPEDIAMAFWPEVSVIAGAKETLSELCRNYPLYIATNASVSTKPLIERALERGGLREHIREIFCFTEIGFRKSQLEFWRVVESTLRIPLNQIAMIGDSLEQDVLAPRQFGLFTVWFNENGRQPNPKVAVPMVTQMTQFAALIGLRNSQTQ